ncbi:uncharacterized protein LOC134552878 [Prinia subflava]|uniref:uncharacterized protein LOC134552878 n=1 Tax=Prinia subflava TaxID=208062 RepID=UPI002FE150F7
MIYLCMNVWGGKEIGLNIIWPVFGTFDEWAWEALWEHVAKKKRREFEELAYVLLWYEVRVKLCSEERETRNELDYGINFSHGSVAPVLPAPTPTTSSSPAFSGAELALPSETHAEPRAQRPLQKPPSRSRRFPRGNPAPVSGPDPAPRPPTLKYGEKEKKGKENEGWKNKPDRYTPVRALAKTRTPEGDLEEPGRDSGWDSWCESKNGPGGKKGEKKHSRKKFDSRAKQKLPKVNWNALENN